MTPQSDVAQGLRALPGLALNALLPPRCLGCGAVVARTAALCADCWKGVHFLEPPLCALCGFPLEYDLGPEALCGACVRAPPGFDRARAVMRYHETYLCRLLRQYAITYKTVGNLAFMGLPRLLHPAAIGMSVVPIWFLAL